MSLSSHETHAIGVQALCGTGQAKNVNKELLVFSGLELRKTQFNRFNRTSGRF
jgi:hypothetical protein